MKNKHYEAPRVSCLDIAVEGGIAFSGNNTIDNLNYLDFSDDEV